jgi:signal transduction histidine kinase
MRLYSIYIVSIAFYIVITGFTLPVDDIAIPSAIEMEQSVDSESLLNDLLSTSWSIRNNNPELALQYGMQAMELARKINDYENLVKAHSFVGVAHRLLGNYMQAVDIFFDGLALAKEHGIAEQEGYAYINIANLYIYLEYYNVALENLEQALEIASRIEHKEMLSYVYLNRGRALIPSNQFEEARESVQKSLELRIETGNTAGQAVSNKYLGDIYFNESRFEEAFESYQQSLELVKYESDRHLVGNIYLKMAEINCKLQQFALAEPYALRAIEIGEEVNSRLIIHDALMVLSKVDLELNRFESAARKLMLMIQYADTLTNQRLAEKVMNTEFQWERQRRQAEIDLLNKDKEIQRLRLSRQRGFNFALVIFSSLFLSGSIILLILLKQIKDKNTILSRQKEELDQINKAKDKMFMVIGHDLRGPIWTLKALIELIREEEEILFQNTNLTENFNALTKSVQSVSDLLENLLYWAKAEDGKLLYTPKIVELHTIVNQSLQSYKPWAVLKNIHIQNNIPRDYKVFADENMLKTMVRNLLSNAIKFSNSEGQVDVSVNRENGYHKIFIKDYGIGFSQEKASAIFSKDNFLSTKGTSNEMGSGIGLTLCKEFVEQHGGEIWAESIPRQGSTFYFSLPDNPSQNGNGNRK